MNSSLFYLLSLILGLFHTYGQFLGPSTRDNYCFPGFTQHGSTCYRYVNFETSWAEAWTYCSTMGAHLVTIETADENTILTEIVKNFTKGENDTKLERTWTAGTNLQGKLQWQNSRAPVMYTSWAAGEPLLTSPDAIYCVMKFRNTWFADKCNHQRKFMCEAEIDGLVMPVVNAGNLRSTKIPDTVVG